MKNSFVFRDGCLKVVWKVIVVGMESIGNVNLLIVNVHFHIWKNWMHYVVYIGNSSCFFFFVCSCFSENSRLIFVLFFLFRALVCIPTTSFDKFELECRKRLLKQRKSSDPFEIQTLSNFHQVRWLDKFHVRAKTGYRQQLGLSFQDFQTLPQKVGTENCCLTWSTRNVCKNVSSQPTGLFSRFCRKDSPLFTTATQLFFQSLFSHTLCSRLERFSTANNLSNLWCSKLQHVSTCAFCR